MPRSEALKKAQKKYMEKIKLENAPAYQNIKKRYSEYSKNYYKKKRLEDLDYYREKERQYSAKWYSIPENKEKIAQKRKIFNLKKKEKELLSLPEIDKNIIYD
jgi:hypothetical protein|tara:strand:- start:555 stop:863 length:309 start_codon:yes stop_codon:yes gene_type:complete